MLLAESLENFGSLEELLEQAYYVQSKEFVNDYDSLRKLEKDLNLLELERFKVERKLNGLTEEVIELEKRVNFYRMRVASGKKALELILDATQNAK